MQEDKNLKNMLEQLSEYIKNRNKEELTVEIKIKLKEILEKHFEFVKEDKAAFLDNFNPWQKDKGKKLIQKFVENINNSESIEEFSWLGILDKDKQWEKVDNEEIQNTIKDKSKHVNMRYQIPTHFHGDLDNAVIFHCMENPRGYLGDYKDTIIDSKLKNSDLRRYYEETYKLLNKKESNNKYNEKLEEIIIKESLPDVKEIVKERYQLDEEEFDDKKITNIIYSDQSNLLKELDKLFGEDEDFFEKKYIFTKNERSKKSVLSEKYYYLAQYYRNLLKIEEGDLSKFKSETENEYTETQINAREIAKKMCNLEIYPFSCAEPDLGKGGIGEKILLNTDLSRLGAYIVLRRIYRYLNNEASKPVFIFRKYDNAWKKLFKKLFNEVKKNGNNFKSNELLEVLENHFFYCQPASAGGGITYGNVISVRDFKMWKEFYEEIKKIAFDEIDNLLPKIDTNQDETK